MWLIDELAEARISEAMERGEFDHLPGAGRPLALDDDQFVPEELRVAYRILKNAGFVPREIELRREISDVTVLLTTIDDPGKRTIAQRKMSLLISQLSQYRGSNVDLRYEQNYYQKISKNLGTTD